MLSCVVNRACRGESEEGGRELVVFEAEEGEVCEQKYAAGVRPVVGFHDLFGFGTVTSNRNVQSLYRRVQKFVPGTSANRCFPQEVGRCRRRTRVCCLRGGKGRSLRGGVCCSGPTCREVVGFARVWKGHLKPSRPRLVPERPKS